MSDATPHTAPALFLVAAIDVQRTTPYAAACALSALYYATSDLESLSVRIFDSQGSRMAPLYMGLGRITWSRAFGSRLGCLTWRTA